MLKVYELPEVKACYEITRAWVSDDALDKVQVELDEERLAEVPAGVFEGLSLATVVGDFLIIAATGVVEHISWERIADVYGVLPDIGEMDVGDLLVLDAVGTGYSEGAGNETKH